MFYQNLKNMEFYLIDNFYDDDGIYFGVVDGRYRAWPTPFKIHLCAVNYSADQYLRNFVSEIWGSTGTIKPKTGLWDFDFDRYTFVIDNSYKYYNIYIKPEAFYHPMIQLRYSRLFYYVKHFTRRADWESVKHNAMQQLDNIAA